MGKCEKESELKIMSNELKIEKVIEELDKELDGKKYEIEFTKIKVSRFKIIAETENSVLVELDKENAFWIQKKFVFVSEYTLIATLAIVSSWDYSLSSKNGFEKVNGQNIIDAFRK